jgi:hypothetical protein
MCQCYRQSVLASCDDGRLDPRGKNFPIEIRELLILKMRRIGDVIQPDSGVRRGK